MNAVVTELSAPAANPRMRSRNALRKGQIQPYPMPGSECVNLNKVDWPLDASDAVLLVHDMQQYWLEFLWIRIRSSMLWSNW
ncbi:MAG: hypothetical protein HC765_16260 [Brachymonas sp.]|nr:hypothetical protein [Brachymonas sp.]